MACPFHGIGRLPGRHYDTAPRLMRQELLDASFDANAFIKANLRGLPKSRQARFDNKLKSYALVSVIVERFWDAVQKEPIPEMFALLKREHGGGSHQERILRFQAILLTALNRTRDKFIEATRARHHAGERASRDEELLVCFWSVARKRHRALQGLPFPSMNDLVVMLARVAGVAPEVFRRDLGRAPTEQELFALLRHPHLLRLFTDLMSNDRRSTHPLFNRLEGRAKMNLNDITRTFAADCFEIHQDERGCFIRIKPQVLEDYRSHFVRAAARRARRGKQPLRVLGCPVLYGGRFREMHEWTIARFEEWYISADTAQAAA